MNLFRRRDRARGPVPREEIAPRPRCDTNVLVDGEIRGVEDGLTAIECPSCRRVSRWDLAAPVPLLVRDS